jgi:hypothetical protein
MADRTRNLPFFKETAQSVATLEALRKVPGITLPNYASTLEECASHLRRWSAMANTVATNPEAASLVMIVRRIYSTLGTNKSYTFSPAARDVISLHASMVKINNEFSLTPIASPRPPVGPVRVSFISLLS